jgi:hypothetical protein
VLTLLGLALCVRQLLPQSALVAAFVAALVACFSVLFAKCSMQLLKASLGQLAQATRAASHAAGQTVTAAIAGAAAAVTGDSDGDGAIAGNGTALLSAPVSPAPAAAVALPGGPHGGPAAEAEAVDLFQPLSWLIFLLFIFCASTTYVSGSKLQKYTLL